VPARHAVGIGTAFDDRREPVAHLQARAAEARGTRAASSALSPVQLDERARWCVVHGDVHGEAGHQRRHHEAHRSQVDGRR
jgi:hypothetical protein